MLEFGIIIGVLLIGLAYVDAWRDYVKKKISKRPKTLQGETNARSFVFTQKTHLVI